jgi:hypothetical protein
MTTPDHGHWLVAVRGRFNRVRRWLAGPCVVCGTRHAWFIERDGAETPWCPKVPGNTQSRYLNVRREVAARGVALGDSNDVIIDDLLLLYGTRRAVIEALCADPRPEAVERIAGPRFTTEVVQDL